jgi:hypothetical protein
MRRKIAVLFVAVLASVFGSACGGGAEQQELEILEERVDELEEAVENLKVMVGTQWAEEQKQEKAQP